jgi:hypothetical protein
MIEQLPFEEFDPNGVEALGQAGKPIPGQSLTNNPDTPYPWEGETRFTDAKEALDYIVGELILEENYVSLVSGIGQGVPISDVTMQILYKGFQEGLFNPDLMLMLIEPVMYILIALCEKAGVEYSVYLDDEDDDEMEMEEDNQNKFKQVQELSRIKMPEKSNISKASVPQEILETIEELPVEQSMLARTQEPTEPSLLQRQE